jgi:hypothetical protein
MTSWGARTEALITNPTPTCPGPIGYAMAARRTGLEPVYAPPPDLRALRTQRRAARIDVVIYGPNVVHKDPRGGTFSHPPWPGACEVCDALLDSDP